MMNNPNIYTTLPMLKGMLSEPGRQGIGALGEMVARRLFENAGYEVSRAERRQGDLRIIQPQTGEVRQIEVKTSRRASDRRYHFTLWKKGKTDYRDADTVLLLAVLKSGDVVPFVIPVSALGERSQITISGDCWNYSGVWRKYRCSERNIHRGLSL